MRYAQKLVCIILLVLGVSFSLGGCALLYADFADRLDRANTQNAETHALACYALENVLLGRQSRGDAMDDAALAGCAARLQAGGSGRALLRGQTDTVYADLPEGVTAPPDLADGQMTAVRGAGGSVTALYRSDVFGSLALVTAYDLSDLYRDRDRSLQRYLVLEAVVLLCAALVSVLASHRLTRPLATLTRASALIAGGAYDQRTGLRSRDEVGQLSESFDAMAAAVQEKVAALELGVQQRQDFMSAFSHELKTPMTSIIGYADMLQKMKVSPAEQREAAGAIFHEGKRLETLSRKLLALMSLDETGLELKPMPMETALTILRRAAPFVDCPRCETVVLGDADLVADLLYNLAQNSRRAGGQVWVRCVERPDGLGVAVADNGRGIPKAEQARVLEPFYMVDKSRAREEGGSGLGLALCQRIAQAHGSRLTIESEEGRGTMIGFTLPYAPAAGEEAAP